MAGPYDPAVKAQAFQTAVVLQDNANPGSFLANPTINAGDVKVDKDGGGFVNLATLPTVVPAAGVRVSVSLSATEMTADIVTIAFISQTSPKPWADLVLVILTTSGDFTTTQKASITAAVPTAAVIATTLWTDTTAGDFTVANSIGKSLYTSGVVPGAAGGLFIAGTNAATTVNITGTVSTVTTLTNLPSIPANWLTAAGINAGALNGKGDWLLASSYTSPPSTGAIATAIWQDLLASVDFGTAGSIGALLKLDIDAAISSRSTYAGGAVASVTGNVGGNVLGSVNSVATTVNAALVASGLDAVVVEVGLNARQSLSVIASAVAGVLAGAQTTTITTAGAGVATNRLTVTVDTNDNRTAVAFNLP